jgi:hypothetical protein
MRLRGTMPQQRIVTYPSVGYKSSVLYKKLSLTQQSEKSCSVGKKKAFLSQNESFKKISWLGGFFAGSGER